MDGTQSARVLFSLSLLALLVGGDAYAALSRWAGPSGDITRTESTFNVIPRHDRAAKNAPTKRHETSTPKKSAPAGALQQILGTHFAVSGGALFAFMLSIFPIGVLMVYLSCKIFGEADESLGGKSFAVAFFHRLMFSVAGWVLIITGGYEGFPGGDFGAIFLTDVMVAVVAIGWWLPNPLGRVVVMSMLFCVLDMVALSGALFGSAVVFS